MPGHPIPEPFKWDESFEVFYNNLDSEHKGLFDGIFACAADRSSQDKLTSLCDAVKAHFSNEEGVMAAKGYSNLASHKGIHADFVSKLEGLSVPLGDDHVVFAKEWLVNHIKDIDFAYKGKLD